MTPSSTIARAGASRLARFVFGKIVMQVPDLGTLTVTCWKRWRCSTERVSVLRHQLALAKAEEVALREEWLTTFRTAKRRR